MEVAILLSVYNGEFFLEEQLDSLINQKTSLDYKIYIRDDLSSDKSLQIIAKYKEKYGNIISVVDSENINLGARDSFLFLLNKINADIYMFCDQDDIWRSNKVDISAKMLLSNEFFHNKPLVFCSNLALIDGSGKPLGKTLWDVQKINPSKFANWKNLFYASMVTGCAMSFNNNLKRILNSYNLNDLVYHDQMLAILCAKYGEILYTNQPLIDYRQHSSNVVGAEDISFYKLSHKFKSMLEKKALYVYVCNNLGYGSFYKFAIKKVLFSLKRIF